MNTMEGFDAGTRDLPEPPVEIADDARAKMVLALAAIVAGATPEELAGYLEEGFPASIEAGLGRPGERDEMDAHVNLLLAIADASGWVAATS